MAPPSHRAIVDDAPPQVVACRCRGFKGETWPRPGSATFSFAVAYPSRSSGGNLIPMNSLDHHENKAAADREFRPEDQHAVQRKLGRCMLRLQQYERLMKSFLASTEIFGSTLEEVKANQDKRRQTLATQTLGGLIGQLTGDVIGEFDGDASNEASVLVSFGNVKSFRTTFRVGLAGGDRDAITNDLRRLVALRNDLVHHFLDRFDLWSASGCAAATEHLDHSYHVIDTAFAQLAHLAEYLDQNRLAVASLMASEEFQKQLTDQLFPRLEGSRLEHELLTVASSAGGGWVDLQETAAQIQQALPDEHPKKYTCATWQEVVSKIPGLELQKYKLEAAVRRRFRARPTAMSQAIGS
jgi:hypothetical protein